MVENVTCRLPVFGKHRTALDPKEKQITSKAGYVAGIERNNKPG